MPRNVLATKSMDELAMEYTLRATSSSDVPVKLYNTWDIHQEMLRRVGDQNTTDYLERAAHILKLLGD